MNATVLYNAVTGNFINKYQFIQDISWWSLKTVFFLSLQKSLSFAPKRIIENFRNYKLSINESGTTPQTVEILTKGDCSKCNLNISFWWMCKTYNHVLHNAYYKLN